MLKLCSLSHLRVHCCYVIPVKRALFPYHKGIRCHSIYWFIVWLPYVFFTSRVTSRALLYSPFTWLGLVWNSTLRTISITPRRLQDIVNCVTSVKLKNSWSQSRLYNCHHLLAKRYLQVRLLEIYPELLPGIARWRLLLPNIGIHLS